MVTNEMFIIKYSTFILWCSCFHVVYGTIVSTNDGKLSGVLLVSRNGTPYYAYFGIPFAKPPIGDLRFQPPQESDPWDGIRDAGFPKMKCVQYDRFFNFMGVTGSEDCLYLNVFTPIADPDANIPVMVCIHGGAFFRGESAECFPTYFMDKRIVMVTFDYRLGILGFLSAADHVLPGNYGMKDQVAVLRWVKKNIRAFGGDPDCVTIFGESAGGASVHLHMYSPLSTGLFHRAISQSGSAVVPWATTSATMSQNRTLALGILTGCPLSTTENLVTCLKKLPAENVAGQLPKFFIWNNEPTVAFPVVIEPDIEGAFLTKVPRYGKELNQVPWIVGITSGEGGFAAAEFLSNGGANIVEFNKNYLRYIPILFSFYYTAELPLIERLSQTIKQYYFRDKEIGLSTAFQLRDMVTDGAFAHNAIKSAINYNGTRYFYYYDHLNERSFNEIWGDSALMKFLGVSHGDDLISLYPQVWTFPAVLSGKDLLVSMRMINYWTNFAYYGDPNDGQVLQTIWDRVSSPDLEYLHIDGIEDKMKNKLLFERYSFWEKLPLRVDENYTIEFIKKSSISSVLFEIEYHDEL